MKLTLTIVALAGALTSASAIAAIPTDSGSAGPAADIHSAMNDLSNGKYNRAIEKTERAETGLLNRQSAGDKSVGGALDHVQKADNDLKDKDRHGATSELQEAESALNAQ